LQIFQISLLNYLAPASKIKLETASLTAQKSSYMLGIEHFDKMPATGNQGCPIPHFGRKMAAELA